MGEGEGAAAERRCATDPYAVEAERALPPIRQRLGQMAAWRILGAECSWAEECVRYTMETMRGPPCEPLSAGLPEEAAERELRRRTEEVGQEAWRAGSPTREAGWRRLQALGGAGCCGELESMQAHELKTRVFLGGMGPGAWPPEEPGEAGDEGERADAGADPGPRAGTGSRGSTLSSGNATGDRGSPASSSQERRRARPNQHDAERHLESGRSGPAGQEGGARAEDQAEE